MTANEALEAISTLSRNGVECWVDGGWGVDALLRRQRRQHADLDLIVRTADSNMVASLFEERGFGLVDGSLTRGYTLAHPDGRRIDFHTVALDEDGNGRYTMSNGQVWVYPAEGFSGRGSIAGTEVQCLTPSAQVLCHAHGYPPDEGDIADMEALRDKFGIETPTNLRRDSRGNA
jgi:lincosamide nucleotidyltransferase A/C/D/E